MWYVLCAQSCLILCDPMDRCPPDSPVHGILRQEYWSGLSFPSPPNVVYIHLTFISSKFDGITYFNQLWVSKMDILFGDLSIFTLYFVFLKEKAANNSGL